MNLIEEKYHIIQKIINLEDKSALSKINKILDDKPAEQKKKMSLDTFFSKAEESEKAYAEGNYTSQENLKEEIKKWGKKD